MEVNLSENQEVISEQEYQKKVADNVKLAEIEGKLYKLPSTDEEFQIAERIADSEIIKAMSGEIIGHYFYRFNHGGNEVVDLNATGIFEVAQMYGGIKVTSEIVSNENSPDYEVVASAEDKKRDITFEGAAQQPKRLGNGGEDNYALAKAVTKAGRNALKKVLPYSLVRTLLLSYIAEQEKQELVTVRVTAQHKLAQYKIDPEVFDTYCQEKFGVTLDEVEDVDLARRMGLVLVSRPKAYKTLNLDG